MIEYSLLHQINSPILNSIYEMKEFENIQNDKIFFQKYSFSELYSKIIALKEGRELEFWSEESNLVLCIGSFFLNFYYAKYIKNEDEKLWLQNKNVEFLDYSFTHHFNSQFIEENQSAISELFGKKWIISKIITESKEIDTLVQYPNLTYLTIYYSDITSFEGFPNLPKLTLLKISHNFKLTSFEHLPNFPNLLVLIMEFNTKLISFEHLPTFSKLISLEISPGNFTSFEHFPIFPKLTIFKISFTHGIVSFEHLPILPNLLVFDASNNYRITSFKHFPEFPKLMTLDVSFTDIESFLYFPKLDYLKTLKITGSKITTSKYFPHLINLTTVVISDNQTDFRTNFPNLPNMTSFEVINFERPPVFQN